MSRGRRVCAGLALVALAGCGTTVPLTSQRTVTGAGGGTAGGELGAGGTSGGGTTGSGAVFPGAAGGSTSGSGTTGAPSGTTGASAPGAPTRGPLAPAAPGKGGPLGTAPGVTATTIKIGVFTAQGFGDFAASAGFSVATGDQQAEAEAIIDHINAHGGLAGRKIVPVFHDLSVAGASTSIENEYARACAAWTQDDRVYAVVSPVGTVSDSLWDCLAKKGVAVFAAGDSQDAAFFEKYGSWYYQPTDMNLRRIFSNSVDALVAAGFFGARPKIGLIRVDSVNEANAEKKGLVPALARHGLALSETVAVPNGSNGTSAYSNAVLKFRTAGVTHVMFSYLGSSLLFMTNAENQQYYPRYALHSRQSPGSLLQGSAPAKQQRGAMGIGWQPMNDVDQARDPGVLNARQRLCLQLLQKSGQASNGRVAQLLHLWMCDNFLVLQDALSRAPDLTIAGLRAGAESLGTFPSASTFKSTLAPGRLHDGSGAYRLFAFDEGCTCYQYTSPLKPAS